MRVRVNDDWYDVEIADLFQNPVEVVVDGETYMVEVGNPGDVGVPARRSATRKAELPGLRGMTQGDERVIRCPLPGKIVSVTVTKGQELEAGDEICLLESMKMEQSVRMARSGVVKGVKIKKDQAVEAGQPLLEIQ
ncbi:MAG: acetyl-CoA carboxylase biotin carboxyl carrier protein subunit [Chloroflexi bacterium]|nr:acetyl-CoA carboxylase biotin carboxyl carrier protein subunit [Chloroflexota bacterium]